MLERDIEIGCELALRHQGYDLIDMGIRVDIMEPRPHAKLAQCLGKVSHVRADRTATPVARLVADIDAVSRGVLADDQQFFRTRLYQLLRLAQHRIDPARNEIAS